ncbi:MAG: RloB domain-containing protein [Candidatus Electrothrix sp. AR5]|nr:RloB domain-containing protein [Candidatus Electrothrix sp. AR5]
MRKQAQKRRSKKVYLFVVEGCTEENYINRLKCIYKQPSKPENCKGGSARAVMQKAEKLYKKHKDYYSGYVVWFDEDRYDHANDHNLKEMLESKKYGIDIYISKPCIENWLLAHFEPVSTTSGKKCQNLERNLIKYIPYYEKNNCMLLDKHIDREAVSNACNNYTDLGEFVIKYFNKNIRLSG